MSTVKISLKGGQYDLLGLTLTDFDAGLTDCVVDLHYSHCKHFPVQQYYWKPVVSRGVIRGQFYKDAAMRHVAVILEVSVNTGALTVTCQDDDLPPNAVAYMTVVRGNPNTLAA